MNMLDVLFCIPISVWARSGNAKDHENG